MECTTSHSEQYDRLKHVSIVHSLLLFIIQDGLRLKREKRLSFYIIAAETSHSKLVTCFWATICKTVRPMISVRCLTLLNCLSCLSCPVCDVRALWPNGFTDQDETWQAGRPRLWPHCVRWGPSSPSPKGAQLPPIFGPYLLRRNGCMDQDVT